MDVMLSQPVAEPDPALKSKSSSETIQRLSPEQGADGAQPPKKGKKPRTAELFTGLGPESAQVAHSTAGAGAGALSSLTETSLEHATMCEGHPDSTSQAVTDFEPLTKDGGSTLDDDHLAESRIPWALFVLMSYSSAVTLALTWVLWTGRAFRPAEPAPPAANASHNGGEIVPKTLDLMPVGELPPLPPPNVAKLGNTLFIGELMVTPVEIVLAPLDLVRSIEPSEWRHEESESLILRLRLTNTSKSHAFAPLERRFVREQTQGLDRSTIVTSDGKSINLFPLALESEWSILGQEFPVLKPGESVETSIASEPKVADRLTAEMTWRVHLRIGPYRTDVLGVRFDKNHVTR